MEDRKKHMRKLYATLAIMVVIVLLFGKFGKHSQEDYMEMGEKYLTEAKYEDAFDAYMRVISMDSQVTAAYEGAAKALIALDQTDEAAEILKKGIQATEDESLAAFLEQIKP